MTIINSLSRQPTSLDYASPTQFKFQISKLPKVEYFCTAVNLPSLTISETTQPTPFVDLPLPGTKLTYGTLSMTFLVDENLENFQEIHGWLVGLGFPRDHAEFRNLLTSGNDRFPTRNASNISSEAGKTKFAAADTGPTLSDATLTVLSSKNNAQVEVRFRDLYPTGLTGLQYNQQAADVDYLTATVSFSYTIYDFANVGSSTTTVTTS